MNIIPELNLNKTPNTVKNGSIVGAKNIIIDSTGSYITNENGFKVIAQFGLTHEDEKIVGCIPCNDEIVIFTYSEQLKESNIYRHYDKDDANVLYHINSKWEWHGGRIVGDYIYNYKNQLVLVVGEYNENSNEKIPLLSWILPNTKIENNVYTSEEDSYIDYKIAPSISPYECNYNIFNEGKLICGTYTFFIRFEIYDNTYTKWFQITDNILIYNSISKENPQLWNIYVKNNGVSIKSVFEKTVDAFYVNENNYSIKNILLHLMFRHSENFYNHKIDYKRFQLGYIYQRDTETVGRIKGIYNIDYDVINTISIFDNSYIEETSIDEFYKQPIQYYNVKNIKVYNGRCYIANYEEADNLYKEDDKVFNDNINNLIKHITLDVKTAKANKLIDLINSGGGDEPDPEPEPGNYIDLKINIEYEDKTEQYNFPSIPYEIVNGKKQIKNAANFIKSQLLSVIKIYKPTDTYNTKEDYEYVSPNVSTTTIYDNKQYHLEFNTLLVNKGNDNFYLFNSEDANSADDITITINDDGSLTFDKTNNTRDVIKAITVFGNSDTHFTILYRRYIEGASQDSYYNKLSKRGLLDGTWTYNIIKSTNYSHYAGIYCEIVDHNTNKLTRSESDNDNKIFNYFNRTLLPKQQYKFYIHFIRKNGSVTNGITFDDIKNSRNNILTLNEKSIYTIETILSNYNYEGDSLIYPVIKIDTNYITDDIKNNYIGYFISYEKIENKVSYGYCYEHDNTTEVGKTKSYVFNSEYLYNIDNIGNSKAKTTLKNGSENSITNISQYNKSEKERHLIVDEALILDSNYVFYNNNDDVYLNEYKTLYRLTKNFYFDNNSVFDNNFNYLNGYYCDEILFKFSTEIIGDITTTSFRNENGDIVQFNFSMINVPNYSFVPYFALNIKSDYQESVNNYVYYTNAAEDKPTNYGLRLNRSFLPINLKDFLELKQNYKTEPLITYTNYQDKYIVKFPYTIRRSNVFTDESLNNSFAEYEIDEYKNIFENKGQITNLVGYGLKLYIHCEYALYIFDRDNKLTSYTSVNIPDTFAVDYKEVIVKSYGGLKDKYNSIITDFGYIWYDKINNYIFLIDDSKLNILSATINNFIKVLKPYDVRFAEHTATNRLLVCFYYTLNNINYSIVLSYNFNTQTFISLHDYCFKLHYKTKNIDYIYGDYNSPIDRDNNDINIYSNQKLYIFDKQETNYKELQVETDVIFDVYKDNDISRYIDIVFNNQYELNKVLEAIEYTLNEIIDDFDLITLRNTLEQNLNRRFSGDKLVVFTNETNTLELNINCDDGHNKLNNYKYPYWDKGKWNLNYFRNNIGTNTKPTDSNNQSLIYGKYFIIRFIFNNNRRFKLETVEPSINVY